VVPKISRSRLLERVFVVQAGGLGSNGIAVRQFVPTWVGWRQRFRTLRHPGTQTHVNSAAIV